MQIRAVLADDDEPALRQLQRQLAGFGEISVVGVAHDGAETVEQVERLQPDLLFLDIEMPKLTGFEVMQRLQHKPLVVVITAHNGYWQMLHDSEALFFMFKPVDGSQLARALERIRNVVRVAGRIGNGSSGVSGNES
jgi:two-component system LytT family response regulator